MEEIIEKLEALKRTDKFSAAKWESRGLNPSSFEICQYLEATINGAINLILAELQNPRSEKRLKAALKKGLNKIDKTNLDTEEKEFVAEYFFQISKVVDIQFKDQLNTWLYGPFLNSVFKLKNLISPEKVIETLNQKCSNCQANLENFILKKEKGIPDYSWFIVRCNNCGEYNLLDYGPNIKESRKGEYEYIEQLRKDEMSFEKAQIRLEQIKYFRNK